MDKVHALKEKLLEVCQLLNEAKALGYQVNFSIQNDPLLGQSKLVDFKVMQEVKFDQ